MFTVRVILFVSIIVLFVIAFFIYPSFDQSISAEQSKFTGNENHLISLTEAAGLTKAFRLSTTSDAVLAHYFGRNALESALSQSNCVGLRMYYGKHKDGSPALVIIGVDRNGNDITSGIALQMSFPCPPDCATGSELKQDNSFATLN
jgi:hypothetical protein